jgi:hypothetical protein
VGCGIKLFCWSGSFLRFIFLLVFVCEGGGCEKEIDGHLDRVVGN